MSEHIYSALVIYMGVAKGRRIQPNSHARAIYFTSLAGTICWRSRGASESGLIHMRERFISRLLLALYVGVAKGRQNPA